ncbi:MAG: hypothetical protein R3C53_16610 [Pirellulaceae bacterium]
MFNRSIHKNRLKNVRKYQLQRTLRLESLDSRQMMAADLGVIDEGFQGELLDSLQAQVNSNVFRSEAPLVGSQLAEANSARASF